MLPHDNFTERKLFIPHVKPDQTSYLGGEESGQNSVNNPIIFSEATPQLRTEHKLHSSSLYKAMMRLSCKSKQLRPDLAKIKILSVDKNIKKYSTNTILEKMVPSLNPISITCLIPKVPPRIGFEKKKRFNSNLIHRNTDPEYLKNNQNLTKSRISKSSKRLQDFLKTKQLFKPRIREINFEENVNTREVKVMRKTICKSFSASRSLKLIS